MKLSLYFDVWPWSRPDQVCFNNTNMTTTEKLAGARRYLVEFEIPDPNPTGIDEKITVIPQEEGQ